MNIKMKLLILVYIFYNLFLYADEIFINNSFINEKILNTSNDILNCLIENDYDNLSNYVNDNYGILISPNGLINKQTDPLLFKNEVKNLLTDNKKFKVWLGNNGFPINYTINDLINDFFKPNILLLENTSINKIPKDEYISNEYNIVTLLQDFPENSILVDFYFKPSGEYEDLDWKNIFLILKIENSSIYLLGIASIQYEF